MTGLILATRDGLVACDSRQDQWQVRALHLEGRELTSVLVSAGIILAGAVDGLVRSDDGGKRLPRSPSRGMLRCFGDDEGADRADRALLVTDC